MGKVELDASHRLVALANQISLRARCAANSVIVKILHVSPPFVRGRLPTATIRVEVLGCIIE
jgi:hypothetical protein